MEKFGLSENGILYMVISRNNFTSCIGTTYKTAFRLLNELAEAELTGLNKREIGILDAWAQLYMQKKVI